MIPSRRLIVLVSLLAPIFWAGAVLESFAGIGVICAGLLLVAVLLDAVFIPRRRRIVIRRSLPDRIFLNEATTVTVEIENRGRRDVRVRLRDVLPASMQADPEECSATVPAGATRTVSYRLRPFKRGHYGIRHMDVRALPRVGLLCRQFREEVPAEARVFPNLANVARYELLLRRGGTMEEGLARLQHLGQGWEFESLRPYVPDDEMARIDWKATARRAELIVRNYEEERRQNVTVAIDVGRATAGEFQGMSRLDYLVNATLMLAYAALRQHDRFSLLAFSDRIESYLPPVQRVQSIDRVARALYRLEPRLVESDYAAACRFLGLKRRKRGLICLMTDVIDREASSILMAYLAHYASRHISLAVTLANPELKEVAGEPLSEQPDPFTKAAAIDMLRAREEALQVMRHQGVDVLDVEPGRLTPELINRYLRIKSSRRL